MDPLRLLNAIKDHNVQLANEILDSEDVEDIINEQNNSHKTALYYAVKNKYYDLIKKILNVPTVDPNLGLEEGRHPITQAWITDDARSYEMLIDAGVEPWNLFENVSEEPVVSVIIENKPNILIYYLTENPDLVEIGEVLEDDTLLALAMRENVSIEIGQILIDHGSYVNAITEENRVLLAAVDNIEWAKLLIENGANVNYQKIGGPAPIDHFIQFGSDEMIIYLLDHGANPWMRNNNGNIPAEYYFLMCSLNVLEHIFKTYGNGKRTGFPAMLINHINDMNENWIVNRYTDILDRIKLSFYYGLTFDYKQFTNLQLKEKSEDLIDSLRFSLVELSRRSMIINKIDTSSIPSTLFE